MATSKQWQLARDSAERYERILVPAILGPAAMAVVAHAQLMPGEAVIDVGCGTGAVARAAAEQVGSSGRVVGLDVNVAMLTVAGSLPAVAGAVIEWVNEPADRLPFDDGEFDVAICAQTLQFLAEPLKVLAEIRRVLRPGGRAAISLWCDIEQSPYFDLLVRAIAKHIGADTAAGLGSAFNLTDASNVAEMVGDAGFSDVRRLSARLDLELPRPVQFVPTHVSATPMAAGFAAASPTARLAVIEDLSNQLEDYLTESGMRVPFCTHLISARR